MLMCFLLFLTSCLQVTAGCTIKDYMTTLDMTAYTGGSVLLPCSCTDINSKPNNLRWFKYFTKEIYTTDEKNLTDRVKLVHSESAGNVSLIITELKKEDEGPYRCEINGNQYKDIKLTVKDCSGLNDPDQKEVIGYSGQSVMLPCSCTELKAKPEKLNWSFIKDSVTKEIYTTDKKNLTDRVKLVHSESAGNVSLIITKLKKEDEGPYRCEININQYKDIKLTVKGCPGLNDPDQEEVIGYSGQSVMLPCSCTELKAKPEKLKWRFIKDSVTKEIYTTENTKLYTDRVQLVDSESAGNLSLLILKLNKEDEGSYRCEISNNTYKDVLLKLKDTHSPSSIAGAAAAGGLILFVALIVVIYYRYRGKKQTQPACVEEQTVQETLPETQNIPEGLYSAINPKTKLRKSQKKDDVTYSTIACFNESSPAPALIKCEETEYASVKIN